MLAATGSAALPTFSVAMVFFAIPLTLVTLAVVTVRGLRQPATRQSHTADIVSGWK